MPSNVIGTSSTRDARLVCTKGVFSLIGRFVRPDILGLACAGLDRGKEGERWALVLLRIRASPPKLELWKV